MRRAGSGRGLWCATLLALLAGCSTELPAMLEGRVIRGQVRYGGKVHTSYQRPALQVVALAQLPAPGVVKRPHALVVLEPASYDEPIAYQLGPLPSFRFKVVARIIDLDNLTIPDTELPTGSYPDVCSLTATPTGNVEVTEATPTTGIDITIYDRAGAGDPCNLMARAVCPAAGAGTLSARVLLDRPVDQLTAPDTFIMAVLKSPTEFPTRFQLLDAPDLAKAGGFPHTVVFNDLPPDSYLIYSCYDVGGDNLMGCGAMDFSTTYMNMGRLDIPAGKITNLVMDLGKNTAEVTSVDDPAARGCPAQQ